MPSDNDQLRHSVAFRVTESEWIKLQAIAGESGVTVPQFAKALLFKSAGLRPSERKKSPYGQAARMIERKKGRK
ncbi:MAG: hypothetical protein IPO55_01555 [Alphaproteobacteria bacterium]|nr:hypothetical protein [Alphaproteobacteria bacterium]